MRRQKLEQFNLKPKDQIYLRQLLRDGQTPLKVARRAQILLGRTEAEQSLRRLGDIQLAAFDLLVQAPKQESLQAFLPELFARYREVVEEQLDRLERDGRLRLKIERQVLVPLILNTVLGFGLYYVVTHDEESCLLALSAWRELAGSVVEPVL